MKPALVLLNAYLLEKFLKNRNFSILLASLLFYLLVALFILKQPDVGTFLLITLVFFIQLFLTDFFKPRFCLYGLLLSLGVSLVLYMKSPHVSERVNSFITGLRDINRANYQVKKSIMAYRNAGWLGRGFLEGEVRSLIPDVHTDFIFPAIAEEFGFVIAFLLLSIYLYIALRVMLIAQQKSSNFEFLALTGLSLLITLQVFINLSVSLNLAPTKGITLPLLSYGGSSILGTAMIFAYIFIFTKKDSGIATSATSTTNIIELPVGSKKECSILQQTEI
jgi:cell division protein FtsW